ncbi:MAG: glycosyltransferase family 4 protein [Rhodospirillales bacterium]|nr:glycosyltransferase family 4 protein [Rhodospirillales bacterium]
MTRDRLRLSPLHRLWRLLPARQRREAFAWLSAQVAPRPDADPPVQAGLAVGGEVSRASGLGEGARLMLRGAEELGLPTWALDVGTPVRHGGAQIAFQQGPPPPAGVPLVLHVNPPVLPLALIRLGRRLVRGRRIVGYWAWELPVAPPGWRIGTRFVHEIWVPSSFTAAAMEPLMPGRVRVVRPPLALAPPTPAPIGRDGFGLPAEAVVVLVVFNLASSFVRKNPLGAIEAFRAAFGNRPDRILVLKVTNADHFKDDFTRLQQAVADAPNIRIESRLMPPDTLAALMRAADIVLTLHRSEGLGLVPAEAMLLGRAVVSTGWSGNLDFMDETAAALVPARLIPPVDPRGVLVAKGAVWADPDLGVAAAHLRRLADDPIARAEIAAAGERLARSRFGSETLLAALRGLGAAPAADPLG